MQHTERSVSNGSGVYSPSSPSQSDTSGNVTWAVAQARQAQARWASQTLRQRLAVIHGARQAIATTPARLVQCLHQTLPRSRAECLVTEVLPLVDACRFLERRAARLLAPQYLRNRQCPLWLRSNDLAIYREPLGVVLVIAAANYPLFLPGVQLLQALVAGNAVVLKPGTRGKEVMQVLSDILVQAGLDRELLQVLPETPIAAQVAMTTGVDKVLLTGTASTGKAVLTALAGQLIPAVLELSGCDAAFVRQDADLDLVVSALLFSLRLNSGATCIAPRRIFVAAQFAAELEQRLSLALQDVAPCQVNPDTVARLRQLVVEACAQGARVIAGQFVSSTSMSPMLLTAAVPTMGLLQADLFAPIIALIKVNNDDAALAAAAQCPYALGATVFGRTTTAHALARRVNAGVVVINDAIVPTADPRLPFGGRGLSGFGVTRGAAGLLELTHLKVVVRRRGRWRPHYEPLGPEDETLFRAYLAAMHGASLWQRLTAGATGLAALVRRVGQSYS